jgi:hypothetical protein
MLLPIADVVDEVEFEPFVAEKVEDGLGYLNLGPFHVDVGVVYASDLADLVEFEHAKHMPWV